MLILFQLSQSSHPNSRASITNLDFIQFYCLSDIWYLLEWKLHMFWMLSLPCPSVYDVAHFNGSYTCSVLSLPCPSVYDVAHFNVFITLRVYTSKVNTSCLYNHNKELAGITVSLIIISKLNTSYITVSIILFVHSIIEHELIHWK